MIKILLADDMRNFLDLEVSFLRRAESKIITAKDGAEALKLAKTEKPNIIMLDLVMPKINGIECCRILKNDPALKKIPVVMVTSTDREEESRKAGCDGFMRKPVNESEFLDCCYCKKISFPLTTTDISDQHNERPDREITNQTTDLNHGRANPGN